MGYTGKIHRSKYRGDIRRNAVGNIGEIHTGERQGRYSEKYWGDTGGNIREKQGERHER